MNYYVNLFSPETAQMFNRSAKDVSGFRISRKSYADNKKIGQGDKFICYVTKIQRFIGVLEIKSTAFIDDSPIFLKEEDPFVLRFSVKPSVWLSLEKAIPLHEDIVWRTLSFTKNLSKSSNKWTHMVFSSPMQWPKEDCVFLENLLIKQAGEQATYQFSESDLKQLKNTKF